MTERNLIEKLEADKLKKFHGGFHDHYGVAIDNAIALIRQHQAQPCTDQDAVAKETKEAETLLSDSVSKETLPSEIRVPTDEYIFMILANETLSLSEQLDLLRPYLRTTEPVSSNQFMEDAGTSYMGTSSDVSSGNEPNTSGCNKPPSSSQQPVEKCDAGMRDELQLGQCKMCGAGTPLVRESLDRQPIVELFNEVDCRVAHGAESNGHLEYVRKALKAILYVSEDQAGA